MGRNVFNFGGIRTFTSFCDVALQFFLLPLVSWLDYSGDAEGTPRAAQHTCMSGEWAAGSLGTAGGRHAKVRENEEQAHKGT